MVGGKGPNKEIGQKQSCVGAEHAKVAEAHGKSDVSEWYHPVRVGFEKNLPLESGGWIPTAWKNTSVLLLMLSEGGQEHPQKGIICPFSDTDYAKKSKEEVLRKKREDLSPHKADKASQGNVLFACLAGITFMHLFSEKIV